MDRGVLGYQTMTGDKDFLVARKLCGSLRKHVVCSIAHIHVWDTSCRLKHTLEQHPAWAEALGNSASGKYKCYRNSVVYNC